MGAQTKNEIIAEITATAAKTIEQNVRESLKSALLEDISSKKMTHEAIKRIKSSRVPEFKMKEIKSRNAICQTIQRMKNSFLELVGK